MFHVAFCLTTLVFRFLETAIIRFKKEEFFQVKIAFCYVCVGKLIIYILYRNKILGCSNVRNRILVCFTTNVDLMLFENLF